MAENEGTRNRKPKADTGTHMHGYHLVMPREGLRVGGRTDRQGREFPTLTAARKAAKSGDAIVRWDDRIVVSVR